MSQAASDPADGGVRQTAGDPPGRTGESTRQLLATVGRGAAVVCIRAAEGELELVAATVRSVREAAAQPALIVLYGNQGQAAAGQLGAEALGEAAGRRYGPVVGVGGTLADVATATAPADVVVLQAGCRVQADWLARLRVAANASPEVASASAIALARLSASATSPGGEGAAVPPRLAAPSGPCVYIRRSAIELAGAPDRADFASRCERLALAHVLAPDAHVLAPPTTSDPREPRARAGANADGGTPTDGPAAWAWARARRGLGGLTVAVDARELQRPPDGTRAHLLALIEALGRLGAGHALSGEDDGRADCGGGREGLSTVVVIGDGLGEELLACLESLPGIALARMSREGRPPRGLSADVVHRPHQVSTPADLAVLGALGERLVITQQDLISFHHPSYFRCSDDWEGYRLLTRRALAVADRVVFFSDHVRREALAEGLVEGARTCVVPIGVDHLVDAGAPRAAAGDPPGTADGPLGATGGLGALQGALGDRPGEELILCLGTDLAHKNRPFALRVAGALRADHGWRGRLVLAGAHLEVGSSREEETALLSADPALREAVVDLGPVGEPEKRWLLTRARLVLYPTLHEGFGLIPFEAAAHGVPCLWASGTALQELLGPQGLIVPWDAAGAAASAAVLMRESARRESAVAAVRERGRQLSWERTAAALLDVYRRACEDTPAPAAALERRTGLMGSGFSADAVGLVGPGGALPRELERPLLALATHPRIGRPVFGVVRAAYRLAELPRARRRNQRR